MRLISSIDNRSAAPRVKVKCLTGLMRSPTMVSHFIEDIWSIKALCISRQLSRNSLFKGYCKTRLLQLNSFPPNSILPEFCEILGKKITFLVEIRVFLFYSFFIGTLFRHKFMICFIWLFFNKIRTVVKFHSNRTLVENHENIGIQLYRKRSFIKK